MLIDEFCYKVNDFCLKIYVTTFNGDLSVEKFTDQFTNRVIEYLKLSEKKIRQLQIERKSFLVVEVSPKYVVSKR